MSSEQDSNTPLTSDQISEAQLSVENITMLVDTTSNYTKEIINFEKQGPDLLRNSDKKVTVKEFKFVDKLNIYLYFQLISCNKKIPNLYNSFVTVPVQ